MLDGSNNLVGGLDGEIPGHHDSNDPMAHIDMTGIGPDEDFGEGIGMGGHATNLDGLDKDQIMKMID